MDYKDLLTSMTKHVRTTLSLHKVFINPLSLISFTDRNKKLDVFKFIPMTLDMLYIRV